MQYTKQMLRGLQMGQSYEVTEVQKTDFQPVIMNLLQALTKKCQ